MNKVLELAKENMTAEGFEILADIDQSLPDIWDKPTSSSGKYHLKDNGKPDTIEDHTFEMLKAAMAVMRLWDIEPCTVSADVQIMAITLHDRLKYGPEGTSEHTVSDHDKLIAEWVLENATILRYYLPLMHYSSLIEALRLHSGRWSTDITTSDWAEAGRLTFFVHVLDMLSTENQLKGGE